jgi:hypothetical protein
MHYSQQTAKKFAAVESFDRGLGLFFKTSLTMPT